MRDVRMRNAAGNTATFYIPFKNHGYSATGRYPAYKESFGLSVVDPDKLDRLVRVNTVNVGECFSEVPETGGLLVELVNCSGPWENQVVITFIVPWNGEYPGTGYFEQQARKECQDSDYYFEPSPTTWDQGDRVVVCAKASSP